MSLTCKQTDKRPTADGHDKTRLRRVGRWAGQWLGALALACAVATAAGTAQAIRPMSPYQSSALFMRTRRASTLQG